jgi:hypothetical protein
MTTQVSCCLATTEPGLLQLFSAAQPFLNAIPQISGNDFSLHFIIGVPAVFLLKSISCSIARTKTDIDIFQP